MTSAALNQFLVLWRAKRSKLLSQGGGGGVGWRGSYVPKLTAPGLPQTDSKVGHAESVGISGPGFPVSRFRLKDWSRDNPVLLGVSV